MSAAACGSLRISCRRSSRSPCGMPGTAASHRPFPTARRQPHCLGSKNRSASGAGGYRRGKQPHPETIRPVPGRCLGNQRPPPDALRPSSIYNISRSWGNKGDTHLSELCSWRRRRSGAVASAEASLVRRLAPPWNRQGPALASISQRTCRASPSSCLAAFCSWQQHSSTRRLAPDQLIRERRLRLVRLRLEPANARAGVRPGHRVQGILERRLRTSRPTMGQQLAGTGSGGVVDTGQDTAQLRRLGPGREEDQRRPRARHNGPVEPTASPRPTWRFTRGRGVGDHALDVGLHEDARQDPGARTGPRPPRAPGDGRPCWLALSRRRYENAFSGAYILGWNAITSRWARSALS